MVWQYVEGIVGARVGIGVSSAGDGVVVGVLIFLLYFCLVLGSGGSKSSIYLAPLWAVPAVSASGSVGLAPRTCWVTVGSLVRS